MKIKLLPILLFTLCSFIYAQNGLWQKIPTIIDAGNSVSMAVDSLGYIYNGTNDRGLFQSTDNGLSWHNLDLGFTGALIRKVRVTPDGSIIAATTSYGILISKDNGKTWGQVNGTLSPTDILTISSSKDYLLAGTSNGLFKSNDGGKSWAADTSFTGHKVVEVENISGRIFCFSNDRLTTALRTYSVSSDGGKTWTKVGLSDAGFSYETATFAYDKTSGRVFCAASYVYNSGGTTIGFSSDNGKTWSGSGSGGKLINSLLADSSGILFAACSGDMIIKSTDWGNTWQDASAGINNSIVGSIARDAKGNFYAGTTCGVMFSSDHGLNWNDKSKGLNISAVSGFVADKSGNLYVSSKSSVYRSKDEGLSWAPVMKGIGPGYLSNLKEVNNNVFISHVIFIGMDAFLVGQKFYPDLNAWGKNITVVGQTGVDPKGRIFSLYTSNDIYSTNYLSVSSDGGDSWSTLYTDSNTGRNPPFAVDPSTGIIYLRSWGKLKKSTNDGKTWDNTNYTGQNIIKLRSNSKGYLFAMPDSFNIVRSMDKGNTWQNIKNNLTLSADITEIYFDNKDRVFLLTSDGHVYFSNSLGDSWINITENLPLSGGGIFAIALGPDADIYAAKTSGEIYKITDSALSLFVSVEKPKQMPKEYYLEQNYPNPFNPKTTISYSIPHAGNVNISIFDAMGRKVMELVNEYKSEGIFSVDFDGKNFTSGVYFYRIQSGSYTETKKLMLLK